MRNFLNLVHHLSVLLVLLIAAQASFAQCSLTPAQLKAQVVAYLAQAYPARVLSPGSSDDSVSLGQEQFGLISLRAKICTSGAADDEAARRQMIAEHFTVMVSLMAKTHEDRNIPWEEARQRVMMQLMPESYQQRLTGDKAVVYRPLVPGLVQTAVLDSEQGYLYVSQAKRASWGVSEEELLEQAKRNLGALTAGLKNGIGGEPGKFLYYASRDGYDAARIVSPQVCTTAARTLGEPFFATVPNRDFLIMWSMNLDEKVRANLSKKARQDYAAYDHPLTPRTLRVWGDCRVELAD